MKTLTILLLATFLNTHGIEKIIFGGHKLTMQEAERILGESCQLKESNNATTNGGHKYKSTHIANSSDEKSDKRIALYFSFESYKGEHEAKEIFSRFTESNKTLVGFEMLNDLGDESFFHTDSENFCLIVVRKQNEMIVLKVNKISPNTSLFELKKIAKDIIQRV